MAITFSNTGTGAVPNATVIQTRTLTGGSHVQAADVAPFVPSAVSGGQYALAVTSSTVVTLTVPSGATHAIVSVDTGGNNIRWTRDGTSPTASVGHLLQAGDAIEADNLTSWRMIATLGTVTVQVSYHKYGA